VGFTRSDEAVQMVVGPDGQSYPVFTYIIMVQPNGSRRLGQAGDVSCAIREQHARAPGSRRSRSERRAQ
jgi:hypothetical protein